MASSAIDEFRSFLESLGLKPGPITADNNWHRCGTREHPKKRNGAWRLAPDLRAGWGRNHATHEHAVMWTAGREVEVQPFDRTKLREALREQRRKLIEATDSARRFWEGCKQLRGGHPYLTAHGLDMQGCTGLRTDKDGWLVVPMMRQGHVISVQRISPEGEKLFWPGASTSGCHFNIERPGAVLNVICEGLATGLSLYVAVPNSRVRVTFSAHNILPGSTDLPDGLTVIACDNDHETAERIGKNPGIEAAEKAAKALGCGVAIPPCGPGESDWCDYRVRRIREKTEKRARFERDSTIVKAVDAEINREVVRRSVLLVTIDGKKSVL